MIFAIVIATVIGEIVGAAAEVGTGKTGVAEAVVEVGTECTVGITAGTFAGMIGSSRDRSLISSIMDLIEVIGVAAEASLRRCRICPH